MRISMAGFSMAYSVRLSVHSGRAFSASQSTSLLWAPPAIRLSLCLPALLISEHCCGQKSAPLRSVWGATHAAHAHETAEAAKPLCNLRTNVETPVRSHKSFENLRSRLPVCCVS